MPHRVHWDTRRGRGKSRDEEASVDTDSLPTIRSGESPWLTRTRGAANLSELRRVAPHSVVNAMS